MFHSLDVGHVEADGVGKVLRCALDDSGMDSVRSFKDDGEITGYNSQVCCESDNASSSVAAHHPAASVRVEELHPEIPGLTFFKEHDPVSSETSVPVAKMAYLCG